MSGSLVLHYLITRLAAFTRWVVAGLKPALPSSVRSLGAHAPTRICQLDTMLNVRSVSGSVESWLGDPRAAVVPDKPVVDTVVLPASLQFRRTVTLSRQVLRRGRDAVRLQLTELSPIHPEEACFAFEPTGDGDANVQEVEIAIVRRNDLERARSHFGETSESRIVGEIDAAGRPRLLYEANGAEQRFASGLVVAVIVIAASYFSAWAWAERLEATAQALRTEQALMIADLRQERALGQSLQTLTEAPASQLRVNAVLRALGDSAVASNGLRTVQQVRLANASEIEIVGTTSDGELYRDRVRPGDGLDE